MLIVYKFNFKLLTIWFFLVLRRGEKLHNVILGAKVPGPSAPRALRYFWGKMR